MQFLLTAILLFSPPASDSLLVKQSQKQARSYIKHIQYNQNKAINLWALSAVIEARPQIRDYFVKYVSRQHFNPSFTDVFKDTALTHAKRLQKLTFQTESPLLLAIYILNEPSQEKRKKAVAQFSAKAGFQNDRGVKYRLIIQALFDKKKITEAMLP